MSETLELQIGPEEMNRAMEHYLNEKMIREKVTVTAVKQNGSGAYSADRFTVTFTRTSGESEAR